MKIIETRHWNAEDVQVMCIAENLYTHGAGEHYIRILDYVMDHPHPTLEDIYHVADDIYQHSQHSEGQTVTNIMYLLNNMTRSTFTIIEE